MTADIERQKIVCKQAGEVTLDYCRDKCFHALKKNPPQWFRAEVITERAQCRIRNAPK